jgi:hypothetical protein
MSESVEDTIRAAAEAYLSGDAEAFSAQLHPDARVLGSEQRDVWSRREDVMAGMEHELARRQATRGTVTGSLVEHVRDCSGVLEMGNAAMFSATGDLEIDGYYHRSASWTVVLLRDEEKSDYGWQIVQSHFSIHR